MKNILDDYNDVICRIEKADPFTTFNKNETLHDQPHYTDDRFKHPQVIFGKDEPGINYDYSDRLEQWDYDKATKARTDANVSGARAHTCRWYEAYLSSYFSKPIVIKCIMAGYNWATGYPYQVFGYKDK